MRRVVIGIADARARRDADTTQRSLSGLHPTNDEIETGELLVCDDTDAALHGRSECATIEPVFGLRPSAQRAERRVLRQEFDDSVTPEARFGHAAEVLCPRVGAHSPAYRSRLPSALDEHESATD